ncbi:MAG: hypothetical protein EOO51_07520 [Flavobacterium sp.]|nr:MAG: hypothetical protein EOO51_07520 [Flavobacterium sp.]
MDKGTTAKVPVTYAPDPPPDPPLLFEFEPPPPPPAPQASTVIEVTPAGTTNVPEAGPLYVWAAMSKLLIRQIKRNKMQVPALAIMYRPEDGGK